MTTFEWLEDSRTWEVMEGNIKIREIPNIGFVTEDGYADKTCWLICGLNDAEYLFGRVENAKKFVAKQLLQKSVEGSLCG